MQTDRAALRATILTQRDQLPPLQRQEKSRAITTRLLELPAFQDAGLVMAYVGFRSEVETWPLLLACLAMGKQLAVPRTMVATKRLIPCLLADPGQDLAPGYCGIPEPRPTLPEADPGAIDVVIVPGSVFDAAGGRMGYGGGYYDRFLQHDAPQAIRIGLAFDLQLVEHAPLEPHDQRMHCLITESSTLIIGRPTPCPAEPRS